jgi:hypothetical protein
MKNEWKQTEKGFYTPLSFDFPFSLFEVMYFLRLLIITRALIAQLVSAPVLWSRGDGFEPLVDIFPPFFFCLGFSWALGPDLLSAPHGLYCLHPCSLLFYFYFSYFI